MRRRLNIAECGRLKRLPTKKARITEPVPTSSYLHGKLLLGWLVILLLDSIADFRFEYLYPVVMFMRSVYDSYKYQGLIFSLLFICMVVYLDLLCWTVLAAQWLFLGASSCVWMEVMRNTDYNFSYYTLSLWMLFLYFEVSYRLHNLPQHLLNVSRPFAAHCIGYPVVTMSFLIKHQITHIIRHRQQKKIAEENSFYFDVLQKALPPAPEETKTTEDSPKEKEERKEKDRMAVAVEEVPGDHKGKVSPKTASSSKSSKAQNSSGSRHSRGNSGSKSSEQKTLSKPPEQEAGHMVNTTPVTNGDIVRPSSAGSGKLHIPSGKKQATVKAVPRSEPLQSTATAQQPDKLKITIESLQAEIRLERAARAQAEATSSSLELEIKKLKADLQASCLQEEETTHRVDQLVSLEKTHRSELQRLRNESDTLQSKVAKLSTGKQHDQDFISTLEKRLKEETEFRQRLESELRHLGSVQNSWSEEEVRDIQKQLGSLEKESVLLKKKLSQKDKSYDELQKELAGCHARVRSLEDVVRQLKASLGDETRVKIELFTALSEARRQQQSLLEENQRKSLEISKLKQNLAEVMAILPAPTSSAPTTVTFTPHTH